MSLFLLRTFKAFVLISFFTLLSYTAKSQEAINEVKKSRNSIGVAAGISTGLGFSYRYQTDKLGFEVSGIPIFNGSQQLFISAGASLMYKIKSHEKLDVFLYYGNHLIYSQREMIMYDFPSDTYSSVINKTTEMTMGLGAGVNIHIVDYLDLSLKAGYGLFNYNRNMTATVVGGVGFYYLF